MRFIMIDKITDWNKGESIKGKKVVSLSEDFFEDHFVNDPVMPGVLIIESLAQLSAVLIEDHYQTSYKEGISAIMSIVEGIKFRSFARPGDCLLLESELISCGKDLAKASCKAFVDTKTIVNGTIAFALLHESQSEHKKRREKYMKIWLEA